MLMDELLWPSPLVGLPRLLDVAPLAALPQLGPWPVGRGEEAAGKPELGFPGDVPATPFLFMGGPICIQHLLFLFLFMCGPIQHMLCEPIFGLGEEAAGEPDLGSPGDAPAAPFLFVGKPICMQHLLLLFLLMCGPFQHLLCKPIFGLQLSVVGEPILPVDEPAFQTEEAPVASLLFMSEPIFDLIPGDALANLKPG